MDLILKILLAGFLGAIVGIERDFSGRPAGLRTNMIIAIASCLFTIVSIKGFSNYGGVIDVSRVAAQIVSGVGFLCAGALLHHEDHVLGLTTAADIWLVAAIGMAVGCGMFFLGIVVTIITIVGLMTLAPLSHWIAASGRKNVHINCSTIDCAKAKDSK